MVIVKHLILSTGLWIIWNLGDLGWALAKFGSKLQVGTRCESGTDMEQI